jgi:serine phosphatase RsbU (regulator of sigma subunit)
MRVLVVEDEPDLLSVLAQSLREAGYAADAADDGRDGLRLALADDYDLIVLDLMLPQLDGLGVLRELRKAKTTPVLILTARDAVTDRVHGLEAGADDYLTKPFELAELLARVKAMIRRSAGGALSVARIGEVTGDTIARTVSKLELAREIQMRLTPRNPPHVSGVDVAYHYQPAQWVGGDYCDLWDMPDGRLAFVVADVAGKGLAAAMVMSSLHASLHAGTSFCAGPAEAIDYVNRHLAQHLPGDMFVTLFLGMLDAKTGRLEYVNAGHVPPLLATPGAGIEPLAPPANTVLGIGAGSFEARSQTLSRGACLLAITDGITEAMSPEGKQFGGDGLREVLRSAAAGTAADIVQDVTKAAAAFRGAGPQQDDETVLALRWIGNGAT